MPALPSNLRNKLENTVVKARDIAEAGARAALEALAVHEAKFYPHMSPAQQTLRNQLRAHARQLGDAQNTRDQITLKRLVHECAYEHWHRMLFARFLAENDLLIEPDSKMPISLAEAEELAKHARTDTWTYASRCAQQMLPAIFRPDDPVLQVTLATEHRVELEWLVNGLTSDTFKADDSLGWVYQFWQSAEKEKVNKAGEKITSDTLPSVTQLFTEHYMVLFLLHNTLGAWWAGRKLSSTDLAEAQTEEELRRKLALPGVQWEYLRFVRGADGKSGPWCPAAGTFPGWPQRTADIKLLDPCCGSGHFLVAGFELLVRLRMAEEGMPLNIAVDAVLQFNVFGLEIDARCTQIAVFSLALASWKLVGYRQSLPKPNVACTGLSAGGTRDQWLKILEGQGNLELRFFFGQLYDLFSKAPTLGSLINPHRFLGSGMLDKTGMETLLRHLQIAISDDPRATPDKHEMGIAAQGVAKAAELLADKYTLVVTNVPYLGRGKQDEILKEHLETQYPLGKADLATAFVLRCLEFCDKGGSTALVTPQNWLFQATYAKLRETLLERREFALIARLGPKGFQTPMWDFNVLLSVMTASKAASEHQISDLDASDANTPEAKAVAIQNRSEIAITPQAAQLLNPDAAILSSLMDPSALLSAAAATWQGLVTTDDNKFLAAFWEVGVSQDVWAQLQTPPDTTDYYGGRSHLIRWCNGQGDLHHASNAHNFPSSRMLGRPGIALRRMPPHKATLFEGTVFDDHIAPIVPSDPALLPALWCFCTSEEYADAVHRIDQQLKVAVASFLKVPFDLARWQTVAAGRFPDGLPEPESDDPTQWLFHGRPAQSTAPLQVAVVRLLGYRWPAELDAQMRLSRRARDLVKRCDELLKFADDDGIVCIPSVRGEEPATDRLLTLLSACGVKPHRNLDEWLRDDFFQEHCKLFHHRPFVWHIWDGRKRDGFHALVNYHKLADGKRGKKLLESLTYSYLGEWINRQQDGVKRGEDGAEDRLDAATELQQRLVAIIEGEPPFDLFVRWKPLAEQPIGWEPDIDDGVRVNIRPFLASDLPNGKTGTGVLRWKPNIKWAKDRGKELKRPIREYPWFWGWDGTVNYAGGPLSEFTGERHNDCHYTTEFKRQARQQAAGKS
ncbi:Eco57I restriction-modification methylase domain-containing protein [Humisphaera borealis]|uniref:site-specific DNA-methyltransferase (adenine-specific) n=1 Tax=Humisphaera borealis TaxID=2807512 RepID=A0A7M2WVC0_9BACT|nr:N-6 DNA methylase [Humisphaera borealis]QOV89373.1 N-6 DNA methylase [Humisphaera borealis]